MNIIALYVCAAFKGHFNVLPINSLLATATSWTGVLCIVVSDVFIG